METRILDAQVSFLHQAFSTPLRLSSGVITEITEARAEVTVEVAGQRATGRGSIYLSDLWAWPDPSLSHEQRDAVLRARCDEIAARLPELCGEPAHPLELGLRLHHCVTGAEAAGGPPVLARALCASPFDAALHDAAGIALERSAFHLYRDTVPIPAADALFPGGSACAAVERVLRPTPAATLDAWLVVAPGEALAREMEPWARGRGYRCFKLKLLGKSAAEDAAFTAEVFRTARELGVSEPRLSGDPNGGYPGPSETLEYLERLRELDAEAFAALEYVEQ
ncbi:MAG TPA: hypothetical protein VK689_22310, partial [Armatimonadota bacterium]|nr:hypothetical protein [Armatimonadota bacterium]